MSNNSWAVARAQCLTYADLALLRLDRHQTLLWIGLLA